MPELKSIHYTRVKGFMVKAGQTAPDHFQPFEEKDALLRVRLVLEEALEQIKALGYGVALSEQYMDMLADGARPAVMPGKVDLSRFDFVRLGEVNYEEYLDSVADLSVVNIGGLVTIGVPDVPLIRQVDTANLRKFGAGSYKDENGKWIKPPDWRPPNIKALMRGHMGIPENLIEPESNGEATETEDTG